MAAGTAMPVLGSKYAAIYDRMLSAVAERAPDDARFVAFWPIRGVEYDRNLLVVGRAVNGWDKATAWHPKAGRTAEGRARIIERTRDTSDPSEICALAWVWKWAGRRKGYNTNRSAFWQTAKNVAFPEIVPEAWSSHVAWTNLYKVAPHRGRNPSGRVCNLQFDSCADLLAYEIRRFRPKRVLVMTGRDWFEPFAERLGLQVKWSRGYVEGTADTGGARWVVTKHPERKPRTPIVRGALRFLDP